MRDAFDESLLARRSLSVEGPVAFMSRAAFNYLRSVRESVTKRVRSRRNDFPRLTIREAGDDLESVLLADATKKGGQVKKAVETYGGVAASAGAYSASQDMGVSVGVTLGLGNPLAVDYLEGRGAELVTGINATTRDAMQALLAQGAAEGWSVDQLAYEIGQDFSFSWSRARTIARTEMTNAYSEGSLARAQALVDRTGVRTEKRWLVNEPEDDECIANGETEWIDVRDEFPSGDARPPVHPNCECALVFRIVSEDGGGIALSADLAPGVIDDVLARRKAGESFLAIAKAHGQDNSTWSRRIIRAHAPELLGKITTTGFTGQQPKIIRGPRVPKATAAQAATGEEKWWLLDGDKFQTLYPGIQNAATAGAKLRALQGIEQATNGTISKQITEKWITNNAKVPDHLRDVRVALVSEMDRFTKSMASVGSARANAWMTTFQTRMRALRPPNFLGIEDGIHAGWLQDTEFTIMHELGHHAIYRAGFLHPEGAAGETAANLFAERMLGRQRYDGVTNASAIAARAHLGPKPALRADVVDYTSYGGKWYPVTRSDVTFIDRVIARGDRTARDPRITLTTHHMSEAEGEGRLIVFGMWRCQDGIAPKAIALG